VGDLLGVLVVTPPLLWLAGLVQLRALPRLRRPALRPMAEAGALMAACMWLTLTLWRDGLGVQPAPLMVAAAVFVTWLAGSYADAQTASRAVLDRPNRLLFQVERLKTLRAMSVAVIHEISQPLSTLAIETAHLQAATADLPSDIAQSAALVDRKARTLAEMVRRLRRFGGRGAGGAARSARSCHAGAGGRTDSSFGQSPTQRRHRQRRWKTAAGRGTRWR